MKTGCEPAGQTQPPVVSASPFPLVFTSKNGSGKEKTIQVQKKVDSANSIYQI